MISNKPSMLYPRLALFYFFFFAALGAFIPYWPLYLESLHFSAIEIGELMAIVMVSKLTAPYFLGWLSDYLQKRLVIIQFSMLFTVIAFLGVFQYQTYWWLVSVMAIFGFFWNASLPLFESLTLSHLKNDVYRYSHIRLWGSVGFIIMVVVLTYLLNDKQGANSAYSNISLLPILILVLLIANGISTLLVKDKVEVVSSDSGLKVSLIIKSPIVIAFLVVCCLQIMSHGAYHTFFSIYLNQHNYSLNMIGGLWALGVVAEIILFIVVHKYLLRHGPCKLLVIALFLTVIRWVLLALWVDNLPILVFSQFIHAASFGLFHATAIDLIHRLFPGKLQGRGQALYAGLSFGLGGSLGSWLSGYSWSFLGPVETFLGSAIIALIGAMIAAKYIKKENLPAYAIKIQ